MTSSASPSPTCIKIAKKWLENATNRTFQQPRFPSLRHSPPTPHNHLLNDTPTSPPSPSPPREVEGLHGAGWISRSVELKEISSIIGEKKKIEFFFCSGTENSDFFGESRETDFQGESTNFFFKVTGKLLKAVINYFVERRGGLRCTEEAFLLHTQQPWVWIPAQLRNSSSLLPCEQYWVLGNIFHKSSLWLRPELSTTKKYFVDRFFHPS